MSDLFRSEVIRFAGSRLQGRVILDTRLSLGMFGYALTLCVFAALLASSFATYARKETVSGWLAPNGGIIRVTSRSAGVLESIKVGEGQFIGQGQLIANVKAAQDSHSGNSGYLLQQDARQQIEATDLSTQTQIQKLELDKSQLISKRLSLLKQLDESVHYKEMLDQKVALNQKNLRRSQELNAKGYLSDRDLDSARSADLATRQELSVAENNALSIEQEIALTNNQIASIPVQVQQAKATAAATRANLRQNYDQISVESEFSVTSPINGKVMALPVNIGQTITSGSTVAVVIPRGSELQAELFAPSRAIGFVKVGQEVALHYQAFPYQKFGTAKGRILSVSHTILAPDEINVPGSKLSEPVFRIQVAIPRDYVSAYGTKVTLQPGMLLDADIVIERQSLLRWLLDPVFAVGKRL